MKLEDLKSLNKDDILAALGLESKRTTTNVVASSLGVFSIGLAVGAAAALLFAPKTGKQMRDDVGTRMRSCVSKDLLKPQDSEVHGSI